MGREGSIEWREGGGMAHSLLVAPLEMEIVALCLAFGWLEAGGMRREGEGMRREEQGMGREEVFAGHEAPSEWEEAGGMRLAGLITRRLAPALFDNRWSKQESGRGPLPCSYLSIAAATHPVLRGRDRCARRRPAIFVFP